MSRRYFILTGFTVCLFIVFLNVTQYWRHALMQTLFCRICNSTQFVNKIIRFTQLPDKVNDTALMFVYGEQKVKKVPVAINPAGDLISDSIRGSGIWESNHVERIVEYLQHHPELHFLDIGSNIGVFTLNVASIRPIKRQIVAVDANERNCQLLGKSLAMNGWTDQVMIVNNGLDSERGENNLIVADDNIGASVVDHGNDTIPNYKGNRIMKIHSIFFDDLLDVIQFREAVMKMDIEYSENRALKTAKEFFNVMHIPVIMLEWYGGGPRRTQAQYEELLEFFYTHNYEAYTSLSKKRAHLERSNYNSWPPDVFWLLKSYSH